MTQWQKTNNSISKMCRRSEQSFIQRRHTVSRYRKKGSRMAACVPQRNGLAVCAHICPPSWTPSPIAALQVIAEHHAELPVPCGSFLLAVSFTRGGVYVSVLLSQFVLLSPLSPLCPQFVLFICISATRFISTILLLPTYMC